MGVVRRCDMDAQQAVQQAAAGGDQQGVRERPQRGRQLRAGQPGAQQRVAAQHPKQAAADVDGGHERGIGDETAPAHTPRVRRRRGRFFRDRQCLGPVSEAAAGSGFVGMRHGAVFRRDSRGLEGHFHPFGAMEPGGGGQGKVEGGAGRLDWASPTAAAVSFDDGLADRQPQTQPVGFGGEKRVQQLSEHVGIQAGTGVLNRDFDAIRIEVGGTVIGAWAFADAHGVHRVADQIENHLLDWSGSASTGGKSGPMSWWRWT
jgi:hypothetical protein